MSHYVTFFTTVEFPDNIRVYIDKVERFDYVRIMDVDNLRSGICFENLTREEAQNVSVLSDA